MGRAFTGNPDYECPKCGFGFYNAIWAYGGFLPAIIGLAFQAGYKKYKRDIEDAKQFGVRQAEEFFEQYAPTEADTFEEQDIQF